MHAAAAAPTHISASYLLFYWGGHRSPCPPSAAAPAEYLRRVNNVPSHYSIGKLCTEDPISVSRKFSLKFHAFFHKVLLNGKVLGNFYWKKYQARGAPHYHVLRWIRDAPVIGKDDPDKVLAWIQDRITCHIPDKSSSPELYQLVTRYQLHKCSSYCKRRRKCGKNTFVTRCRFGFPRPVCDNEPRTRKPKVTQSNISGNTYRFRGQGQWLQSSPAAAVKS